MDSLIPENIPIRSSLHQRKLARFGVWLANRELPPPNSSFQLPLRPTILMDCELFFRLSQFNHCSECNREFFGQGLSLTLNLTNFSHEDYYCERCYSRVASEIRLLDSLDSKENWL